MKEYLTKKLRSYISENNPDLLIMLQEEKREEEYVTNAVSTIDAMIDQLIGENKPLYIIEEICLEYLTRPLRPSKYNYIKAIAEEKFPRQYEVFQRNGILTTELINILTICLPLFEVFHFSEENEDDDHLAYVIKKTVKEYFIGAQVLVNRNRRHEETNNS